MRALELVESLKWQAKEIAEAGHKGWGNAMVAAAEKIESLLSELETRRATKGMREVTDPCPGGKPCTCQLCALTTVVREIVSRRLDGADADVIERLLSEYHDQGNELDAWRACGPEDLRQIADSLPGPFAAEVAAELEAGEEKETKE